MLFLCLCNIWETFHSRCMRLIFCVILQRFLWNFISSFRNICVCFIPTLGVVEYLHDLMPKKKYLEIGFLMDVIKWYFFFLRTYNYSLVGTDFLCLVGGYTILQPCIRRCRMRDFWPNFSWKRLLWRAVLKDVGTYNMSDLTVLRSSFYFLVVSNWFCCNDAAKYETRMVLLSCGSLYMKFCLYGWVW